VSRSEAIIYIAGPMTGIPELNKPTFRLVANDLAASYRGVLSPHTLPDGLDYKACMDITMAMVRACDIVFCLPGWQRSRGARAEIAYAECLGKKIVGAPD